MGKKQKFKREYIACDITINDVEYRYEKSGNGCNLLLIPGGGMEPGLYGKIATELSKNYTVFNLSRLGRANMLPRTEELTLEEEAEFFLPLIKHLEIEYVVGHSSGAVLSVVIASKYKLKGMAIYEPPICDKTDWFGPFKKLYDEGHYVRAIRYAMKGMSAAPFDTLPRFITLPIFYVIYKKYTDYVLTFEKCILSEMKGLNPVYERILLGEKISIPTFVGVGDKTSKMLRLSTEKYYEACEKGKFKVYPKYSHINPLMEPEVFCKDVVDFFNSIDTVEKV